MRKKIINYISRNKKAILISVIMMTLCMSITALPMFPSDPNNQMYNNNWDAGFIKGICTFGIMLWSFRELAKILCTFFFFLNICWHSFKLWFGATEIRKVAIDIICKMILVIACMNIYPSLVDGVLSLGTNLGVNFSNGGGQIASEMMIIYEDCYEKTAESMKVVQESIASGKIKKLSKNDMNKLASALNMSPDELTKKFEAANSKFKVGGSNQITKTKMKPWQVVAAGTAAVAGGIACVLLAPVVLPTAASILGGAALATAGAAVTGGVAFAEMAGVNAAFNAIKAHRFNNAKEDLYTFLTNPDIENQMIIYKAFNDMFGTELITDSDLGTLAEKGPDSPEMNKQAALDDVREQIEQYFTAPFLDIPYSDEEGSKYFRTAILSPSILIRIGILEARVLHNKADIKLNTDINHDGKTDFNFFTSDVLDFTTCTFAKLATLLIKLLLPWLLIIPVIYCVINYVVCVLEYYIVTSIGIIFVPLLLFDPTKQYAHKLINMFISYFIKFMVISIVTYFCLAQILAAGRDIMCAGDSFTIETIAYAIFTLVLTLMLSQGAPQIASVLLTGDSRMSLGDVANVGRQIGHAVHMGQHAAQSAGRAGRQAAASMEKGGQLTRAGYENAQTRAARKEAVRSEGQKLYEDMLADKLGITRGADGNYSDADRSRIVSYKNALSNSATGREVLGNIQNKVSDWEKSTTKTLTQEDREARRNQALGRNSNARDNRSGVGMPDINAMGGVGMKDKEGRTMDAQSARLAAQNRAAQLRPGNNSKEGELAPPPRDE